MNSDGTPGVCCCLIPFHYESISHALLLESNAGKFYHSILAWFLQDFLLETSESMPLSVMFSHSLHITNFWKCDLKNLLHLSHCDGNVCSWNQCGGHPDRWPGSWASIIASSVCSSFPRWPSASTRLASTWQSHWWWQRFVWKLAFVGTPL